MSKNDRKPAPEVRVFDPFVDERSAIIKERQAEDPESVYSWQRGDITARELQRLGQEVVKDGEQSIDHGGDVLVKVSRDFYKKQRTVHSQRSYQMTERITRGEPGSLKKFAKAVTVKRREAVQDDD